MRLYRGFVCGSNALVITDILQQPGHTLSSLTKIPSSQELERGRARAGEGEEEILVYNWVIIEFYCSSLHFLQIL